MMPSFWSFTKKRGGSPVMFASVVAVLNMKNWILEKQGQLRLSI